MQGRAGWGGQAARKILPLELPALERSKSPPTTFFVLTNLGHFGFGMSLFQTMAGVQQRWNFTIQFKSKSKVQFL